MERTSFNYSLKNIPVPTLSSYKLRLIEKTESVIKRMRWKAHYFLKVDSNDETKQRENLTDLKQDNAHLNAKKWKTSNRT